MWNYSVFQVLLREQHSPQAVNQTPLALQPMIVDNCKEWDDDQNLQSKRQYT
jgi:hypothetical protein